ncbi:MAG: poly-gamma-glutamate biosynthesis protein PgsC [Candidatus Eisenbacteria bacterium]|nr:poly-gamma-glutamate biosynthesis protein PgsC [Candidatus Latescibacterota bacterium]MBD3302875.1 poly-gamma-glutamate biosynthesis protein PgsC [Candidatus Eisenbacteria bacterium]
MIAEAIGLGLVASLFFTEAVGFAAGGFVVPGYIALYLDRPLQVLGTVLAALLTYGCLKLSGRLFLVYGRRTLVLSVLLGFVFGALISRMSTFAFASFETGFAVIGFIIPGLLAYWMTRQGIVQTLAAMVVAAVIVRLALIVFHGGALLDAPLL